MKITKIDVITIGLPFENPGPESSFAIADKNFLKSLTKDTRSNSDIC